MTHEEVPLADVFREVGRFLIGREDVVLFGAQAVNVYAETERMTQGVDVMSTHAEAVTEELRRLLSDRFRMAMRVRVVVPGAGYRLYQVRKPKNRHLGAPDAALNLWHDVVREPNLADDEDGAW